MTEAHDPTPDADGADAEATPQAPAPVSRNPFAVPSADAEPTAPAEQAAESVDEVAAAEAEALIEAEEIVEAVEIETDIAEVEAEAEVVAEAEALVEAAEEIEAVDAAAESVEEPDEELDPAEEMRLALRSKPGEWYVVHSYAGYENRVKGNIESRTGSLNMEDYIFQVEVPVEDVIEIKNNQKKTVKRNKFPGYVLVRMDLTDSSWSAVRNTPGVTGFVGHGHQPTPLTLDEVVTILAPKPEKKAGGAAATEVRVLDFEVGDSITIVGEHPFAGLLATIDDVNPDSRRVKAVVEIFGRETPVELEFSNIQKN